MQNQRLQQRRLDQHVGLSKSKVKIWLALWRESFVTIFHNTDSNQSSPITYALQCQNMLLHYSHVSAADFLPEVCRGMHNYI